MPLIQMGRLCYQPHWLCIDRLMVYACKQWASFATCEQYCLCKQGHIYVTPLQRDTTRQGVRPNRVTCNAVTVFVPVSQCALVGPGLPVTLLAPVAAGP